MSPLSTYGLEFSGFLYVKNVNGRFNRFTSNLSVRFLLHHSSMLSSVLRVYSIIVVHDNAKTTKTAGTKLLFATY